MASELPQLNVRIQPMVLARLTALQAALQSERGCKISQAEAVAFAILETTKKILKKTSRSA